ncbi:Flagellin N-methylase [compost metagenome]
MKVKECLRCGSCCSGMFAIVPKTENSDLSPSCMEKVPYESLDDYIETNGEPMGTPCKWLKRDTKTTEAFCTVHEKRSTHCRMHPEHIVGSNYCHTGLYYWRERHLEGLPVPDGVLTILHAEKRAYGGLLVSEKRG